MRRTRAVAVSAALAVVLGACAHPAAVPPLSVPGQPPPGGMIADGSGGTCAPGQLGAGGLCPGSQELSWPPEPPSPLPVPDVATLIVAGNATVVRYGPGDLLTPALARGTSPMTITVPLDDAAGRYTLTAALPDSGGSVTVTIAVNGTVTSADTQSGPDGIALAEVYLSYGTWQSGTG